MENSQKDREHIFQLDMNSNGRDITGKTFLHHMTGPAYFVIVKYLLENSADWDLQAPDEDGLSPIMHAAIGSYRPGTKKVVIYQYKHFKLFHRKERSTRWIRLAP